MSPATAKRHASHALRHAAVGQSHHVAEVVLLRRVDGSRTLRRFVGSLVKSGGVLWAVVATRTGAKFEEVTHAVRDAQG